MAGEASVMDSMEQQRTRRLMQADGRCIAAIIFGGFGGCWMLMGCSFSHRLHAAEVIAIGCVSAVLVVLAVMLKRSLPRPAQDPELQRQHAADSRSFNIINAVTYSLVFLEGALLPKIGFSNYVFPLFVALVGLHFFPMKGFYRHKANRVTGGALVVLAALSAVAVHTAPYRVTAMLTFSAGIVLWVSAVWAMRAARLLAA